MARINRVRIINFYYNNDIRQIADETFSFFGGENALLNLANGGGKSVLIQLMLQPVIPDCSLQKRTMSSYFKRNTQPAYILLEWILDNPAKKDYLLTGIAIAPKITGDENAGNRLNYFTFVSHYSEACKLDLGYVPFSRKENGRQIILTFEKAREAVRKLAGDNSEIFYYGRDDGAAYRNKLSEFRISQEEWKNIIARMNNDEGGIDELFEKCSTSNKLVDEWLIKTVEKAVMASDTENTQIYELMEGLVTSTLRNEEHIRNRKNLNTYLTNHVQLEKSLENVCNKLDAYSYVKDDLNHLFRLLKIESARLEADLSELQFKKDELEEQLGQINLEEKSEEYYHYLEDYNTLKEQEEETGDRREKVKNRTENLKRTADIQKAARNYEKCQGLKGEINGLLQKLESQRKEGGVQQRRINDLKFSLGLLFREKTDKLVKGLEDIDRRIEEMKGEIARSDENMEESQRQQNEISVKLGVLKNQIALFETFQNKVSNALNISFIRNLLGVIDEKETNEIQRSLETLYETSLQTLNLLLVRNEEINNIRPKNQLEKENLIEMIAGLQADEKDKAAQRDNYIEKYKKCLEILKTYELPEDILFDTVEVTRRMNAQIQKQEERNSFYEIELSQIQEMINGIKDGQVYIPKALTDLLVQAKVGFQTGEMYLNELSDEKRQLQLIKNPLLPFGIIVEKGCLGKISNIKIEEIFLRQVIPVFTYSDLRKGFKLENPQIVPGDGYELISSYEPDLFSDARRETFLLRLMESKNALEEQIKYLKQELSVLRDKANILSDFQYEKDYLDKLEQEILRIAELRKSKEQKRSDLEYENRKLEEEYQEKLRQTENTKRNMEIQKQHIDLFLEFLEKDKEYTNHLGVQSELLSGKDYFQKQQEKEREKRTGYQKDLNETYTRQILLRKEIEDTSKRANLYEAVKTGDRIEGSIEMLEREYQSLCSGLELSIKALERELSDKREILTNYEHEIEELHLELKDYENTQYDDTQLKKIKLELAESLQLYDSLTSRWQKVHDEVTVARTRMNTAFLELQKIGMSQPLPKEEIKQDYVNRRKRIRLAKDEIKENESVIRSRSQLCDVKAGIFANLIKPEIQKNTENRFELEEDIDRQCTMLQNAYKETENSCKEEKKSFLKLYDNIRKNYENVHASITDILNSLLTLDISGDITYDKVYFYLEELMKKRESLEKLLNLYEQQLSKMEDTKRQVTDQCVSYATQVFEGLRSISEKSKIKLGTKKRTTQMLSMGIPKELEHSTCVNRMKEYIEATLKLLTDYLKKEDENYNGTDKKYKEKLRAMVSARQLLNQLIGKETIPVSIYKIELNENNSGMKSWEDAMKENSGGEKFVCFFTVASTLISYTREATGKRINDFTMQESKVMIMDNPFARTSSEHLLKAVIDIARTFQIQLICLSDLSQSSITNRFNLIYTLSVRQKLYSDKEVLHIENVRKNKEGMVDNERLEHAVFHQTFEQGNLFDFMDE